MMKAIKIVAVVLLVCLLQRLAAQDNARQVLNKVKDAYGKVQSLSVNITYTYYEDVKSTKPLKVSKGLVKMKGEQYYVMLDQMQMLRNETFLIVSDNKNKVLMIDSASATPPGNYNANISVDSLVKYMGAVSVIAAGDKQILTVVNGENSESLIKKTEITVNKNFLIERLVMYYKTIAEDDGSRAWNPKMTIDYSSININGEMDKELFNENRFFNKKGKSIQPVAAYKAYELINHIEQ